VADARPTIDFDAHSSVYAGHSREILQRLRRECPVGWMETYGGAWVVSRYDDVAKVLRDPTFTVRHDIPNDGRSFTGVLLPECPQMLIPMEIDGPVFTEYRRLLNPWFSPEAAERLRPQIVEFTNWCIDQVAEAGAIDLILDLANPVPALTTLEFLGLPVEDWEFYAYPYHAMVAYPQGSEGFARAVEGIGLIMGKLAEAFADRKQNPRDDLLTALTQTTISGAPIPDTDLLNVAGLILAGGVDTTTALLGHAFHYLDRHPEDRQRLIEHPELIPTAGEELLRWCTPGQTHTRTALRDMEIGGQHIKAGERVVVSLASANEDEAVFDRADEVVLDRTPNHHTSFGFGPHRCLGASIARVEFEVVLREVLRRMPDFRLGDGAERYTTIGQVNGWVTMPATFAPTSTVGSKLDGVLSKTAQH
jgi:cytochrome P450